LIAYPLSNANALQNKKNAISNESITCKKKMTSFITNNPTSPSCNNEISKSTAELKVRDNSLLIETECFETTYELSFASDLGTDDIESVKTILETESIQVDTKDATLVTAEDQDQILVHEEKQESPLEASIEIQESSEDKLFLVMDREIENSIKGDDSRKNSLLTVIETLAVLPGDAKVIQNFDSDMLDEKSLVTIRRVSSYHKGDGLYNFENRVVKESMIVGNIVV